MTLVSPAVAQPAVQAPGRVRPILAIYDMQDHANTGQSAAFSQMLQSAITASGRFTVIERHDAALAEERNRGRIRRVRTASRARAPLTDGADYLLYGTITSVNAEQRNDLLTSVVTSVGMRAATHNENVVANCTRQRVTLAVDLRVTDRATGQVRYTTQVNRSMNSSVMCSTEGRMNLATLLRAVADEAASKFVTTIYPIQVAAVQSDGSMILNYGAPILATGTLLSLNGPGSQVVDPGTGRPMQIDGPSLGQIRVTEANPNFARAMAVRRMRAPVAVGAVVRWVDPPARGQR